MMSFSVWRSSSDLPNFFASTKFFACLDLLESKELFEATEMVRACPCPPCLQFLQSLQPFCSHSRSPKQAPGHTQGKMGTTATIRCCAFAGFSCRVQAVCHSACTCTSPLSVRCMTVCKGQG